MLSNQLPGHICKENSTCSTILKHAKSTAESLNSRQMKVMHNSIITMIHKAVLFMTGMPA